MSSQNLEWNGEAILERARRGAVAGMTEVTQRIEAEAKKNLYPGHGLLTGALRRSIVGEPGRLDGDYVIGRVATKGVPYARKIERRYGYLVSGYEQVRPRIKAIVSEAIKAEVQRG